MNKKILVPLGRYHSSEEMIPYIEKVARPGMKVFFLVRYPGDGFLWAKEEYGMRAALKAKKLVNYYSWEVTSKTPRSRLLRRAKLSAPRVLNHQWMFMPLV
jgi:hypothetical protein